MDTSIIQSQKADTMTGIKWGANDAPVKMIEFVNLRCPYCKQWFEESDDLLTDLVQQGKLQRIIKLFDKEKPSLKSGNIMHQYVDPDNAAVSYQTIKTIFKTQSEWGNLPLEDVAAFAENTLHLAIQNHKNNAEKIILEANECNIQFVPTIIVGKEIFDENISIEKLKEIVA